MFLKIAIKIESEPAPSMLIDTSELALKMIIHISWKTTNGVTWENARRIKLLYYVDDEPQGLIVKSMFTKAIYTVEEPSVTSSTRDLGECALLCLTNDECQFFKFDEESMGKGYCKLSYIIDYKNKILCESNCYEIKKSWLILKFSSFS